MVLVRYFIVEFTVKEFLIIHIEHSVVDTVCRTTFQPRNVLRRFFTVTHLTDRITLFRNRLIAGSIAASAGAVLLAAGNHALSILISGRLPQPDGWNHAWFRSTAIVLIGTIGFFLFAAFVCDSLKNQPAAMCICGVPFAFSYFINVAVLKKFEFFWFVRYGFFAEWLRGRKIGVTPGVWGVWYALLLGGLLLAAIHQRKEHKEL